jgi:sulfur relay (sulfurtransferase) DsrF/TusC family protein
MPTVHPIRLAVLVQSNPYAHRLARTEADFALAAAALDIEVRVYFMGRSMLQLVSQRATTSALLPVGYRAWAALPDLGDFRIYVEDKWWDYCLAARLELVMPVEILSEAEMKQSWRKCHQVVAL